jgi:hypothetical protein
MHFHAFPTPAHAYQTRNRTSNKSLVSRWQRECSNGSSAPGSPFWVSMIPHPACTQRCLCDAPPTTTTSVVDNTRRGRNRTRPDGDDGESCTGCLWTGVGTCLGLASYFTYTAYEIERDRTLHLNIMDAAGRHRHRYTKPIYLAISVGWLGVGAYRYSLG